jgi:hypothetical protein
VPPSVAVLGRWRLLQFSALALVRSARVPQPYGDIARMRSLQCHVGHRRALARQLISDSRNEVKIAARSALASAASARASSWCAYGWSHLCDAAGTADMAP